jgi:hypothetical protein
MCGTDRIDECPWKKAIKLLGNNKLKDKDSS